MADPEVTVSGDSLDRVESVVEMIRAGGDAVDRAELRVWLADDEPEQATLTMTADAEEQTTSTSAADGAEDEGVAVAPTAPDADGKWVCEECGASFDTEQQLHGHRGKHAPKRPGAEYEFQTADEDEGVTDAGLREITPGTAAHEALTVICANVMPTGENGITASGIKSEFFDHQPSTMSGAGVRLYRSLLVERRRNPETPNAGWEYEYRPTAHGVAELGRVGPYAEGRKHELDSVAEFEIGAGTGRHEVLSLIDRGATTTVEIEERLDGSGLQPQSVGPTAYDLARAGYVEREPVPKSNGHGQMYEYELTERGRETLDRIGHYGDY